MEVVSSGPAAHDRAVVMVCDDRFAPFAACLGASLLAAHPRRRFDVCLLVDGEGPVPGAEALRVLRIRGANPFAGAELGGDGRRSHTMFLRLLLPRLLGREYGRILYLDSDIHLDAGDLATALSLELHGAAVGAVRDHDMWRSPDRRPDEARALGLPGFPYCNSGVLLLDAARFEAEGWLDRMVALAADPANAKGLMRHDQSVLNLALRGRWAEMSPVWNWQYTRATRFAMAHAEPRLVHFIGRRKPWLDAGRDLPPRFRARPHAFLAEHAPDHPALAALDPAARAEPHRIGASYFAHWRRWRATEAYLARFPSEATTHAP